MKEQWLGYTTRRLFHLTKPAGGLRGSSHDDGHLRQCIGWIYMQPSKDLLAWMNATIRSTSKAQPFYSPLDKAGFKMLVRKKPKHKKKSLGFIGGLSGSARNVDDRVVMLCDDIPSEGSSRDSGQGSHSSETRSSSDDLGHGWKSRSFHGREGQSISRSSRPTKQYSVREIRHVESSPVYGQNGGRSTLRVTELYESAHMCFLNIIVNSALHCTVEFVDLVIHLQLLMILWLKVP